MVIVCSSLGLRGRVLKWVGGDGLLFVVIGGMGEVFLFIVFDYCWLGFLGVLVGYD